MKPVKLKENYLVNGAKIKDYLQLCGIKADDCASFLIAPKEADELDPILLLNMNVAAKTAFDLLSQDNTVVFVQVDSDMDGWTSASELIQYINYRFPNIKVHWRLHTGKQHGVVLDTVPEEATLVFIPDAGSNQVEELKALTTAGKTVIILDHHKVEDEPASLSSGAIIVNNQCSPDFPNKFLSGAGVVYKFIQYLDTKWFHSDYYKQFADLAALGILADAMDMRELDNNYIAYLGLHNITNKLIKAVIAKQAGDGMYARIQNVDAPTKTETVFYIAPTFNGLIRFGEQEEKEQVFKAFITPDSTEIIETTYRGVVRKESLYDYCARIAVNAKSRQDNAKKKGFGMLKDLIDGKNDKDNIIIATLTGKEADKISPNITGLVAMDLVKEYNRPALLLREVEIDGQKLFSGSGRNGNFKGLESLLDFLHESGLVEFAQGHDGAFGVMIKPENVEKLRKYSEQKIDKRLFDNQSTFVDYWFKGFESIRANDLAEFASHSDVFCGAIPTPTFAFEFDIDVNDCTLMGKDSTTIKFKSDFVNFIVFKRPDLAATIIEHRGGKIHVLLIGNPSFSQYGDLQVIGSDCEVSSIEVATSPVKAPVSIYDLI